jgi:pyrimidine operon attenuation protein/uracil phosphoribosyltransferase
VNLIDNLKRTISEIENDLAEFRATCAHVALNSVKERGKELERDAQELNKML